MRIVGKFCFGSKQGMSSEYLVQGYGIRFDHRKIQACAPILIIGFYIEGQAMLQPKLDLQIKNALGENIETANDAQNLILLAATFVGFMMIFGIITIVVDRDTSGWIVLFSAPLLGALLALAMWFTQFHKPYIAVGSNGVAFPLVSDEVIHWKDIDKITLSEVTLRHSDSRQSYIGVQLDCADGFLMDRKLKWHARIPFIGQIATLDDNKILLSTIYCRRSTSGLASLLLRHFRNVVVQPPQE